MIIGKQIAKIAKIISFYVMPMRDYFKKILWHAITPVFPLFRNLSKLIGYQPYPARQEYHLGYLAPGKTADGFRHFLMSYGFGENKIAWVDEGEILSLRLRDNFRYQYHVRLFNDNEIRGHYELTPEYSPIGHLRDKETSARTEEFIKMISGWLAPDPDSTQEKSNSIPRQPHCATGLAKDNDANQ